MRQIVWRIFSLHFGKKVVSLRRKHKNGRTMSEATLTNLLEYLYETLTPSDKRWVGERLIKYADFEEEPVKPYTMEEINAMIDEAERNFEAGLGIPSEDVFRELEKEFEKEEHQLKMA